jgi:hypothetical protein
MQAQRGMGPGQGRVGGNPIAPLINMRRELNLSARQLTQLDSIERTLLQRNQGLRDRMRSRVDSLRPRGRLSSEEEIARFRAQGDSMRALRRVIVRNDSVARAAAMAILTDSQRIRVRERVAEQRGFAAGRRSAMRGGQRGFRQGRMGAQGFGGRMRPGNRMGMGGAGRVRPPGAMRGPGGFGMPDDSIGPMRRRGSGMNPPAGMGPDGQGFGPRRQMGGPDAPMGPRLRRPPADSGR